MNFNIPSIFSKDKHSNDPGFSSLKNEIDKIFNDFTQNFYHPFMRSGNFFNPSVDVINKDNQMIITSELPGVNEKDIEINLNNGILTIQGKKEDNKEEKDEHYQLIERRYGKFTRSFQVPYQVTAKDLEASFRNGILTIRISKPQIIENDKNTRIEIKIE